jgi:hypothetical protein
MKKSNKNDSPKNASSGSTGLPFLDLPKDVIAKIKKDMKDITKEAGLVKIGQVAIDSGHLLICDPVKKNYENAQVIQLKTSPDFSAQYSESRAVVIPTDIGDGLYDVEAVIAEVPHFGKCIMAIQIAFVGTGSMYPIVQSPGGEEGIGFIDRHQDKYED